MRKVVHSREQSVKDALVPLSIVCGADLRFQSLTEAYRLGKGTGLLER